MSTSHEDPDAGLLDELARCYAAAVVRSLLEGEEEDSGEHAEPTTKSLTSDLSPDDLGEEMPF